MLQTITRRIIIQKARRRTLNCAPTACKRMVSGSFPPLKGVLFIFRSLYCALSVVGEYLALRDGPRGFSQGFTWLDLLRIHSGDRKISRTGRSPSMVPPFQTDSAIFLFSYSQRVSYNPSLKMSLVWAPPLSLAATYGIDFSFYSSGYLDVSVLQVCNIDLCIQSKLVRVSTGQLLFNGSP